MFWILRLVLLDPLARLALRAVSESAGWLRRRIERAMNLRRSTMTNWGATTGDGAEQRGHPGRRLWWRTHGAETRDCGTGGCGLDYSAASVAASRETKAQESEAGRVQIEPGSVAALPFPGRMFDIVTAVETHYYWPDLPANAREVLRVLNPGGTLALIAETYRGGPLRLLYGIVMPLLRSAFLNDAEQRDLLTQAGFTEVATKHVSGKNWICPTGCKPTSWRPVPGHRHN